MNNRELWIADNNRQLTSERQHHHKVSRLAYKLWEIYGRDADTNWFAAESIFWYGFNL